MNLFVHQIVQDYATLVNYINTIHDNHEDLMQQEDLTENITSRSKYFYVSYSFYFVS